jgi:hypothetical protein
MVLHHVVLKKKASALTSSFNYLNYKQLITLIIYVRQQVIVAVKIMIADAVVILN